MEVQLDAVGEAVAVSVLRYEGQLDVVLVASPGGSVMLTATPRIRIVGHGRRLRVRTKGSWSGNSVVAMRESCRASVAVEKAVAEAIHGARAGGLSWEEIGRTLVPDGHVQDKRTFIDAFADSRRAILEHQLRRTS
jgi:hypothetical protein